MVDTKSAIDGAVERVIQDFQQCPGCYFTEEDVRWRLMKEIEDALTAQGAQYVKFQGGVTSAVHGEYPTPFRCSMGQRSFRLLGPMEPEGRRGHFDIVVLNASAANCNFEVLRSQCYENFLEKLLHDMPLPFLDVVIEIKLFRDLVHPGSAKQHVEYAVQAVNKVAAALEAQPEYYPKPFAKRGMVLLFDNSDLAHAGDVELAPNRFQEVFEKTIWDSVPDTLLCVWVTPRKRVDYHGQKRFIY